MRSFILYPLCLLICLVACQQMPVTEPSSPYFLPPPGTTLVLNRPIDFPPNTVSQYLQYGRIQPENQIDSYQPNCKFEIRHFSNQTQTVNPDDFVITRSQHETDIVLAQSIEVASASLGIGVGIGMSDGGPMAEIYTTIYDLHSAAQPQVLSLTCRHWDQPTIGNHLTLDQIRQALGDIMSIKLAGNP